MTRRQIALIVVAVASGPALLVALLFGVLGFRLFVYEPFRVPSGAMIPTLLIGDHMVVQKFAYNGGAIPDRGDVVVFEYPRDRSINYVERVVALPGERIAVKNNRILINGVVQPTTPLPDGVFTDTDCTSRTMHAWLEDLGGKTHTIYTDMGMPGALADLVEVTVPADAVFVMGDNRDNSEDGRRWGFVPLDHLKGKATSVWMSRDACTGAKRQDRWGLSLLPAASATPAGR